MTDFQNPESETNYLSQNSDPTVKAGEMTFIQHLTELRFRLKRTLLIIVLGTIACWAFSEHLFDIIRAPIKPYLVNGGLVFTSPIDKFMAHIKLSFIAGVTLSCPFWLYQFWKFISPALYKNERNFTIGFIFFGTLQFVLGVLFCYFIVFPMAFKFLMTFGGTTDTPMITIDQYLGFFTKTALVFGMTFEMPVVISFLGMMGVVSQKFLKEKRRYAIVGMAAVSAVAAPPDALSMILLLGPLWLMYEISVFVVGFLERRKPNEAAF